MCMPPLVVVARTVAPPEPRFSASCFCRLSIVTGKSALMLPFTKPAGYGLGKSGWVEARFVEGEVPPMDMLKDLNFESVTLAEDEDRLVRKVALLGAAMALVELGKRLDRERRDVVLKGMMDDAALGLHDRHAIQEVHVYLRLQRRLLVQQIDVATEIALQPGYPALEQCSSHSRNRLLSVAAPGDDLPARLRQLTKPYTSMMGLLQATI